MDLKEDTEFDKLLQNIKKLPESKILQLKAELSTVTAIKKSEKTINEFQKFLLKGPVMDDEQYKIYKQNRNHFNKWRTI